MNEVSLSRTFARWASGLSFDDLPGAAVDKAKALLLHALAGTILGSREGHSGPIVDMIAREEGRPAGASVFGIRTPVTRAGAAYANAEIIHSSQLWDSYRMLTHPGPVIVPVVLANAELEGRNGKDVLLAMVVGYEFMCRLCHDFIPSTAARGFRPSPIYSTMGAALASAKVLGLDEQEMVTAIALATNFASGLFEGPRVGTKELSVHEPQAARNGVLAASLARTCGFTGAESSLEGRAGFYNAFTGNADARQSYVFNGPKNLSFRTVSEGLSQDYKFLRVMFRMYPCAGFNQPVIELISHLKRSHGFKAEDVTEIVVTMNRLETLYPSPEFPRADWLTAGPETTHFYAAYTAIHGSFPRVGALGSDSANAARSDPELLAFMRDRVRVVADEEQDMFSPRAAIYLKDGTRLVDSYPYSRMEWSFDRLVDELRPSMPSSNFGRRYEEVVDFVRRFETVEHTSAVFAEVTRALNG